jgi:hydrogenase-1 operon protein HyaE
MHPLIQRLLTDCAYPHLDTADALSAHLATPGTHCLFTPGDAARNLETADAAVILPELRQAFQGRFDCAVIGDAIEAAFRESTGALKTPSFVFFRDGALLGAIPKVRDWDDYLARTSHILGLTPA